jgi:hypothetical protein
MKKMIFGLVLLFCGTIAMIGVFIATILYDKNLTNGMLTAIGNSDLFLYFVYGLVLTVSGLIISIREYKKP